MPPDDLLGHRRPTVMRVTEDDDIGAQFVRSLENDVRDVMFGGLDEFSMHSDSGCGKLVDGGLHYFLFTGGYVFLAIKDTKPRSGVDVVDDHVAAPDVQQVDRPTGHLCEPSRPFQEIIGEVRRYIESCQYAVVHCHLRAIKGC
jgi:hypothetical protein